MVKIFISASFKICSSLFIKYQFHFAYNYNTGVCYLEQVYIIFNNFTFYLSKRKMLSLFYDNIAYFLSFMAVFLIFLHTNFNYVQIFKSSKSLLSPYFILLSATLFVLLTRTTWLFVLEILAAF